MSLRWFLIVLAIGLALTGCRTTATPRSSTTAPNATDISVIGVLMNTNPMIPGAEPAAQRIATAAGGAGAQVVVDRFGANADTMQIYNARVAAGSGANELVRRTQLERAQAELVRAITDAPASGSSGPVDVISGVRAMEAHLHALSAGPTDVAIIGNVVQTAPPIDLGEPTQLADPTTTLERVVARGLMPNCQGWRVYMIGGSLTADGPLDTLRDAQLREFWRQFFARCGGQLVVWDIALTAFPTAGGEVAPASWTQTGSVIVPLPATLLFEADRAVLRPEAVGTLDQLVVMVTQTYPSAAVELAGYTAAVGGPAAGAIALAQARAQAVANYLTTHGVTASRLSVVGRGDQDPVASNATEAGRTLNRRVVATLHLR